ncbi:hypothetical protein KKC83_06045 [Patescibacteria group bacterium]|nr:hypothetical protein [Candidatus Falkowbacteria bacterium]MBU3905982.1 hypothetical protein [Patescibacteria group bacterium]MCG2697619.1 hypothetical protein [Candidatus Parcubacteria bacterium]MBU4015646.1 hypothetical protein [Patescibacteria group bacterium]MBU4027076.1 hypothetical protein [Patescibacteria group bacterium]
MRKKILIISAGLFLLTILAGIYWLKKGASHFIQPQFYNDDVQNEFDNKDVKWITYQNEEYGFEIEYPEKLTSNKYWAGLPDELTESDVLIDSKMFVKNNNFYLHQEYEYGFDWRIGQFIKLEDICIPEYNGKVEYGLPWHIVFLDIDNENKLDELIKQKYGASCSYQEKHETNFSNTYDIKIKGDGKDLGSTKCPINYRYHLKYSPIYKRAAFWHTGQECILGLSFDDCYDQKISDSFRFID